MSSSSDSNKQPTVLVTGGSSGLGRVIAKTFARASYRVVIVGRSTERLEAAVTQIQDETGCQAIAITGDVSSEEQTRRVAEQLQDRVGRLDVLVNCIGASDRGLCLELTPERLDELFRLNVTTTLLCSQAMMPMLEASGGSIVNIGSLGGKVGARYLGGYNAAKHALTGLTQQMRLENREKGVHIALVSPGPIRRDDAGTRYSDRTSEALPDSASQPGGGTKVKGLDPQRVANAVLRCARKRGVDVILPGYLRILIVIGNAWPRLGDWLLIRFTS